jgi:hypothetical protein
MWNLKRWGGGCLRRVLWLVRPGWEWAEKGVSGLEELTEATSPMLIGEGGVHG